MNAKNPSRRPVPARRLAVVAAACAILLSGMPGAWAESFASQNIPRFDSSRNRQDSGRLMPNFRAPRVETYSIDDGLPGSRRVIDGTNRYRIDRYDRLQGPGPTPLGRVRRSGR